MTASATLQNAPHSKDRLVFWLGAILVVALVSGGLWLRSGRAGTAASDDNPILGLRLGMTPGAARREFAGEGGQFRTETREGEVTLHYTAAAGDEVTQAELEFHEGFLVVLRATVTRNVPDAVGPEFAATGTSVLVRSAEEASTVGLTWYDRTCPDHADEVRRVLREHEEHEVE